MAEEEPKVEITAQPHWIDDLKEKKATAVATSDVGFINPIQYAQMKQIAGDFIASKALPKGIDNVEQLLMMFQAGAEMGMKGPVEAMNSLYIVNGRINLWGSAVARRFNEHGWKIKFHDESDETCSVTLEKNKPDGSVQQIEESFSFSDAEASGYTKNSDGSLRVGWKPGMNRKLKMRYGVLALIAKTLVPEVLGSAIGVAEIDVDAFPEKDNKEVIKEALERKSANLDDNFEPQVLEGKPESQ